ncbi:MAG: glycosyltransferase family 4 protein [Isosphaeraceae bacterium]
MKRARILLITGLLPWPAYRFGGPQRSALILAALERIGTVDILLMAPPGGPIGPADEHADRFRIAARFQAAPPAPAGPWRHLARVPSGAVARLGKQLSEIHGQYEPDADASSWLRSRIDVGAYDLVVCRHLRPALLAGADQLAKVPRILDLDDIDWRLLASQIQTAPWPGWKGSIATTLALRTSRRIGDSSAGRFDVVWVASDEDRAAIQAPRVRVLPNVPFQQPGSPPIEPCPHRPESRRILCVSELSYAPNRDGIDHFIRQVWPTVHRAEPGATLQLAGGGLDDDSRRRWSSAGGIEVSGFVEDLRAAYDRAACTIAPIFWGGGTKIKVIESLAYGRTCVATPHALHGYGAHLRHGESIWRGGTDAEMADGCIRLLRDADLRERMAAEGHRVVTSRFSPAAFSGEVLAACRTLLEERPIQPGMLRAAPPK